MSTIRMRIGFDAKRAFCNYRGLGSYSRLLIESLARTMSSEENASWLELFLMTPKISMSQMQKWPMEQFPKAAINRVMPKGIARLWPEYWRGYSQVECWKRHDLDLYHGLSHDLPWSLNVNGKSKTKTVVTIHDLIFIRQPELYPWWDRPIYTKKVTHSCHVADSIVAISQQAKADLMEFLNISPEKIKIIYQAVHPRFYKSENKYQPVAANSSRPYFLFVGALETRKNVLRLVQAFSQVSEKVKDFQLIIVGKGRLKKNILDLVDSLSLGDRVILKSDVKSEDLPPLYQNAFGVVYPSLLEGFGLPIVEAMMSETLVLTSQGSCFPEAGGEAAYYVNPLRIDEIAEGMLKLIHLSLSERQERIALGLQHVQRFHWKNTANELLNHYQSLL